jgi:CheY-like chemotaxis protein
MFFLSRLWRRRPLKGRPPLPASPPLHLAFERLETRCLLSLAADPTLFITAAIRSPLRDESPASAPAAVRVDANLGPAREAPALPAGPVTVLDVLFAQDATGAPRDPGGLTGPRTPGENGPGDRALSGIAGADRHALRATWERHGAAPEGPRSPLDPATGPRRGNLPGADVPERAAAHALRTPSRADGAAADECRQLPAADTEHGGDTACTPPAHVADAAFVAEWEAEREAVPAAPARTDPEAAALADAVALPPVLPAASEAGADSPADPGDAMASALASVRTPCAGPADPAPTAVGSSAPAPAAGAAVKAAVAGAAGLVASPRLAAGARDRSPGKTAARSRWLEFAAQFLLLPRFSVPRQPTVMLALNDETALDEINVALVREGFLVLPAPSTHDAMGFLRAPFAPIDVAVVDVDLDIPGIHLSRKIREMYPRTPVLVCAADADHPDLSSLQGLGVHRCFLKPIAVRELVAAVNGLVS